MHASLDVLAPRHQAPAAPAGMSAAVEAVFRGALAEPSGIILVAAPAGSGRTTTLKAGLALRPGAVTAGEIMDRETAEAAVQAAFDGSLVIAAIQAPNAVGAITRLRLLGIERFLIASTLRAVLAQRLARHLCSQCRRPVQAKARVSALLGFDPGAVVYEPDGCAACGGTGYRGRIGLFEAIGIDAGIGRLINGRGDEAVIASHAFRGRPDLGGAARAMVRAGLIPAEDALQLSRSEAQSQ